MKIRIEKRYHGDKIRVFNKIDEYSISGGYLIVKYTEDESTFTEILPLGDITKIEERA